MRIVIIGGSHAGLAAAEGLKKLSPAHEVILLEKGDVLGFIPSSLNFIFEKDIRFDISDLTGTVSPESLLTLGVDLRLNSVVTEIKPRSKTITISDRDRTYHLNYDRIILAMGSEKFSVAEPMLHTSTSALLTYKSLTETKTAYHKLKDSHHITIIGAGLIGLELASSLAHLSEKKITLVEQMSRPLFRYFDDDITIELMKSQPKNLTFIFEKTMKSAHKTGATTEISLYGGDSFTTDAAVLALNPRPNTHLINYPIQLNHDDTVKVNRYMQTDDPAIYAIGDLIKVPFGPRSEDAYLPLISIARRTALIAVSHIANHPLEMTTSFQRTISSKIFGKYLGSTGITFEEGLLFNIPLSSVTKRFVYYSKIYEKATFNLTIKLLYTVDSHVIIGAQVIANDKEALQIISVFSRAIAKSETLESMLLGEYFYAPILSSDQNFITQTLLEAISNT
ncbi:FAD-dependent oxidoreductase [Enterococcus sp. AD013-P3]|uniref:NAD(P)/FAD-dependent oxidoreductase n=1 Tax=Enterococcus sp. AD013-P3 TaxID=3411036 RepID=UPI003B929BD1